RLRRVPRARRPHAAHRARRLARNAVVPRLPSRSGTAPAADWGYLQHELHAAGRSERARCTRGASRAAPAPDRLLDVPPVTLTRRNFLKLGAAAAALATGACSRPREPIVPYAHQPEAELPGVPRYYASAASFVGGAEGLLIESNTGRPTKVEGNPAHPASVGATSVHGQASVLQLWDPERYMAPRR